MLPLFALTIFLGAALLFLVQPMVAKMILPQLGGSPAVWNTCMVFFQTALLAGYSYAHLVGSIRKPRVGVVVHAVCLATAAAALPIGLRGTWELKFDTPPIPWLLGMLALGVGAPFLMISTGGSLLQKWFATTDHPAAKDPYFLYSASNAGSMLGLLAYPFLVERFLTLGDQRVIWSIAYGAWSLLVIACGLVAASRRAPASAAAVVSAGIGAAGSPTAPTVATGAANLGLSPVAWDRLVWVILSAIPSSLLLGVTQYLSVDLAAVPLLWVVPLAVYLLTFIIAFAGGTAFLVKLCCWLLPMATVAVAVTWTMGIRHPIMPLVVLHVALLFFGALACHGLLAARRPEPRRLTEFYLFIALGGVLGGAFNALLAPVAFVDMYEYPIAMALACLVAFPELPGNWPRLTVLTRLAFSGGVTTFLLLHVLGRDALNNMRVVYQERTFFGIYRVLETEDGLWHQLSHGTTNHGMENMATRRSPDPTTYYTYNGPLGDIFGDEETARERFKNVAVVGLGVGTIAAYGRDKSQNFVYYEIDPAVVRMAGEPSMFSYVTTSKATVSAVIGDARLTLAKEPDGRFDLIILDAFSSDAIPMHLLTREAVEMYLSKLAPNGRLAFHVSNRYLFLGFPLGVIAHELGLAAYGRYDDNSDATEADLSQGKFSSDWIVMARKPEDVGAVANDPRWLRFDQVVRGRMWTDDYSNILAALKSNFKAPRSPPPPPPPSSPRPSHSDGPCRTRPHRYPSARPARPTHPSSWN